MARVAQKCYGTAPRCRHAAPRCSPSSVRNEIAVANSARERSVSAVTCRPEHTKQSHRNVPQYAHHQQQQQQQDPPPCHSGAAYSSQNWNDALRWSRGPTNAASPYGLWRARVRNMHEPQVPPTRHGDATPGLAAASLAVRRRMWGLPHNPVYAITHCF